MTSFNSAPAPAGVTSDGWIVDSDAGIDDALALAALLNSSVGIHHVVASAGNVDQRQAVRTLAGLCGGLAEHRGIRVRRGLGPELVGLTTGAHGPDGLAGYASDLPPGLPPTARRSSYKGRSLLVLGPLTNVAAHLSLGEVPERVVWMGGALEVAGNASPSAEFNARCDPVAVDALLRSGVPTYVVPLDLTCSVTFREGDFEGSKSPTQSLVASAARWACRRASGRRPFHDVVAAAAVIEPEALNWRPTALTCLADSPDSPRFGQVVAVSAVGSDPHVFVADAVDDTLVRDMLRRSIV